MQQLPLDATAEMLQLPFESGVAGVVFGIIKEAYNLYRLYQDREKEMGEFSTYAHAPGSPT